MTRASLANINGMAKYTNGKSSAEIRARKTYERKKAVGKTLFSIVVVFVICWSPTVIFMLIMDTAPKIVPTDEVSVIQTYPGQQKSTLASCQRLCNQSNVGLRAHSI